MKDAPLEINANGFSDNNGGYLINFNRSEVHDKKTSKQLETKVLRSTKHQQLSLSQLEWAKEWRRGKKTVKNYCEITENWINFIRSVG